MFKFIQKESKVNFVDDYRAREALINEVVLALKNENKEQVKKIEESKEYKEFVDNFMKTDKTCQDYLNYAKELEEVKSRYDISTGWIANIEDICDYLRNKARELALNMLDAEYPLPKFNEYAIRRRCEDLIHLSTGENAEEIIKQLVEKIKA